MVLEEILTKGGWKVEVVPCIGQGIIRLECGGIPHIEEAINGGWGVLGMFTLSKVIAVRMNRCAVDRTRSQLFFCRSASGCTETYGGRA